MHVNDGVEASRANLYILLDAMKSGKLALDVEKAALDSLQVPSISGIKVPQKYLDYLIKMAVTSQGKIDAITFLEGLNMEDIDATALLSRNDVAADLHYITILSRAGLVKFKEIGPEVKGFKAADRERFCGIVTRLNDSFLAPITAFGNDASRLMQDTRLSRYPSIRAELISRARLHVSMLEREHAVAQYNLRFTGVIPARDGIDAMMKAFQASKNAMAALLARLEEPGLASPIVSREFLDAELRLLEVSVRVDARKFSDLFPACDGLFKDRPAEQFEAPYASLIDTTSRVTDCNNALVTDLLLYFIETQQFQAEPKTIGNKEKKEIRKQVNQLIKNELGVRLSATWPGDAGAFLKAMDVDEKLSAVLPKLLKHSLEQEERQLMAFTAKNDIPGGEQKLKESTARFRERLKDVGSWCEVMQALLVGEYTTAINPLKESLEHQDQEIARFQAKMDFFFQETKSQEDKVKIREDVRQILAEIDLLVNKFEGGMGLILNKTYIDLERLAGAIQDFKAQYQALLDKLNSLLNRYDAFKLMNIVEEIKTFFEKRNGKVNLVANMILVDMRENVTRITRVMGELSSILKEGTGFSIERGKLGDVEFDEKVAGMVSSIDGAMTEEIIEDEFITKKRLSLIEERLSELETIKKNLIDKKDKLLFRLVKAEEQPQFLAERKVGECIICYEPITTLDEEVVVCPHCSRMGHFLCLAYWYEKYSICPVCHGKLMKPDDGVPSLPNGTYD